MEYSRPKSLIHCRFFQNDGSPVIIFTHGMFLDSRTFEIQMEYFKHQYSVLVWDLPGHGKSIKLKTDDLFQIAADGLLELMGDRWIEKAVLVGQSLGGLIGQYFAYHYPHRVTALVSIGGNALDQMFEWKKGIAFSLYALLIRLFPIKLFGKIFAKGNAIHPHTRDYLVNNFTRMTKTQMLTIVKGFSNGIRMGIPEAPRQPHLITHGDREPSFVIHMIKKWHEGSSNSEYVLIPDAGHIANQDNPEEFNQVVMDFIKDL